MLKDRKGIDIVFKDGLGDYSITPPSYVWDSINTALNSKKKHSRSLILWRTVAAASAAILILVSVGILEYSSEKTGTESFQATVVKANVESVMKNDEVDSKEVYEYLPIKDELPAVKEDAVSAMKTEEKVYSGVNTGIFKQRLLVSKANINLVEDYVISRVLHSKKKNVYYPLYASNINPPSNRKQTSIRLGGLVSPSYSSKISTRGGGDALRTSRVKVNESGINSLGGGLQVRINRGARWSFETGVLYAQVGQQVVNSIPEYMSGESALTPPVQGAYQIPISNSMGKIAVAGRANSGLPFDRSPYFVDNSINSGVAMPDGLKQTLEYLEIPMMARYSLLKSFPYLSLAGGLSSNFLVGNTAYTLDEDKQQEIGETEGIKPFVISSSIGVGVDVPLGKQLHLNIEPRFKYFLNSVNSDSDYSFQPYSFGIYGGIIFVIK